MKPELSLVIPVYNEQDNIDVLCTGMDAYLKKTKFHTEIIFVDDGSTDESVEMLKARKITNATIKIVKLSKNFGAHAALRAGLQFAKADYCMTYFMDMPDPLEAIERFYQKAQEGYDIVYAQREDYKGSIGSRIYSNLVRKQISPDYPKSGISCFLISRKVLDHLNNNVESNSSLYFQLFTLGFRKLGIPLPIQKRIRGKSGWSFSKKKKLLMDTLVTFSRLPLRFVTVMGVILVLVGIIWALAIIIIKLFNIAPLSPGWPTLLAIVLFGFGITNLSIGIIAEYLWRTLDAVQKRPAFIVDEVIDLQKTNKLDSK